MKTTIGTHIEKQKKQQKPEPLTFEIEIECWTSKGIKISTEARNKIYNQKTAKLLTSVNVGKNLTVPNLIPKNL